jgi:hypothetical protein
MKVTFQGTVAMNAFETTGTVEVQGQVHLLGVPFEPGTEVEISIKPAQNSGRAARDAERAARLFVALDKARNTVPIGLLNREELYDRTVLR